MRADIDGPSQARSSTTVTVLRDWSNFDTRRTISRMPTVEQQAELPQPAREEIRIEQVLAALGDPVRLLFVRQLAKAPAMGVACGAIPLPVTKSTRTHHLRIL